MTTRTAADVVVDLERARACRCYVCARRVDHLLDELLDLERATS